MLFGAEEICEAATADMGTVLKTWESLKKNEDFRNVYKKGSSYANRCLVMYMYPNHLDRNRFGISVSKKVGNSVVRHRITRLLRESYRLHCEVFVKGYDIVVIARQSAKGLSYKEIESALLHLNRIHKRKMENL